MQQGIERGFIVTPDKQTENQDFKYIISKATGIPLAEVSGEELHALFKAVYGQNPLDRFLVQGIARKYLNQLIRVDLSRFATFQYAASALIDDQPGIISYGTTMDFYQRSLRDFIDSNPPTNIHNALLAGAMTNITMREFTAGVRAVIPNAACLTVDMNPTDKPTNSGGACQFLEADVCDLPFDSSFDSVHTTGLLDYLGHTEERHKADSPELSKRRAQFFESALKILKPDGILIMVERPINTSIPYTQQPYLKQLEDAEFRNIRVGRVKSFKNRRLLYQYLSGTVAEIPGESLYENQELIGIAASK